MKEIEVKFKVFVNDNSTDSPAHERLTKEFVQKRIEELGNTILDAFDETIHDVEVNEV